MNFEVRRKSPRGNGITEKPRKECCIRSEIYLRVRIVAQSLRLLLARARARTHIHTSLSGRSVERVALAAILRYFLTTGFAAQPLDPFSSSLISRIELLLFKAFLVFVYWINIDGAVAERASTLPHLGRSITRSRCDSIKFTRKRIAMRVLARV